MNSNENVDSLKDELIMYKSKYADLTKKHHELVNKYKKCLSIEVQKRQELELKLDILKDQNKFNNSDFSTDYIDHSSSSDQNLNDLIAKIDSLIKTTKSEWTNKIKGHIKSAQLDKACLGLLIYVENLLKPKPTSISTKPKKDWSMGNLDRKQKSTSRDTKSAWPSPLKDESPCQASYDDRVLFASPDPFLMVPNSEALKIPASIKRVGKH